jgi:short-subunit dehydrogenase
VLKRQRAPRHIIVTGASSGIGRALAVAYARKGVVLGLVARHAQRLEATAAACRAHGAEVVTAQIDVRQSMPLESFINKFDEQYPLDLLIANAGVASTLASTDDWEDLERTAQIVDTNYYGAIHAALPAIERMRARGHGQVALVASLMALRGMAIAPAYCASKAAIKSWADAVRPLLKRRGVSLSVILPGFVQSAMSDDFPGDKPFMWSAEKAAAHIQRKLARRPAEIAFPFLLNFGTRLLPVLPIRVADLILGKLSYLPEGER